MDFSALLPKPKYEEAPITQNEDNLKAQSANAHIPPYGKRAGWRPSSAEDFGDGGAYPEIHVAQYPLSMGKKKKNKKSNAVAVIYDGEGKVRYDMVGRSQEQRVQATAQDLIPLRDRANVGEISLARPSDAEIEKTTEDTRMALEKLVNGELERTRPQSVAKRPGEATYVRYTPATQMGKKSSQQRIIRVQDHQQDPLAPPRFKQTNVADARPSSPPPPILRSPPHKPTAEEREQWYIPPAISNWKNPKGFAVAVDKRALADGRSYHDTEINVRKAELAEALYNAEVTNRKEIRERQLMQERLQQKETAEREEQLRKMAMEAKKAHEELRREQTKPKINYNDIEQELRGSRLRSPTPSPVRSRSSRRRSDRSRSRTPSPSRSDDDEDERHAKIREEWDERKRELESEYKRKNMGAERRIREVARAENRDISERVALGIARPTQLTGDSRFDTRLYDKQSATRYNEDQVYDSPLFAAREALNQVYKTRGGLNEETAEDIENRISGERRFDTLGKAKQGFSGANSSEVREGPVEFVKDDKIDDRRVDEFITNVKNSVAEHLSDDDDDEEPDRKRARR